LPVFQIDKDYVTKLVELPTPADKAAALEAILTAELSEDDPSFIYRQLGERLQRVKEAQGRGRRGDSAASARTAANRRCGRRDQAGARAAQPHATWGIRTVHDSARARSSCRRDLHRRLRPTDGRPFTK